MTTPRSTWRSPASTGNNVTRAFTDSPLLHLHLTVDLDLENQSRPMCSCMIMARLTKLYLASRVGQTTHRLFLSYPGEEWIDLALGSRISVRSLEVTFLSILCLSSVKPSSSTIQIIDLYGAVLTIAQLIPHSRTL